MCHPYYDVLLQQWYLYIKYILYLHPVVSCSENKKGLKCNIQIAENAIELCDKNMCTYLLFLN